MRDVLHLGDLAPQEIGHLLELAARFGRDGIPAARPGRFVCGLFFNPSLRTRTALEIATAALGGHCITHDVGRGVWRLETRDGAVMDGETVEHVRDAIGHFLDGAVDVLAVRSFADPAAPWETNRTDPVLSAVARCATVPLVNLESALYHPMQGLADLLALEQHFGEAPPGERTVAVTWAWHPRPLPMSVANTALLAFTRAGYRVRLVHPPGFDLDASILERARAAGGERLSVHHDMDEGLAGADAIYAKSWGALAEYAGGDAGRAGLRDWIVDARRRDLGGRPAAFLHCLPVRRNVVVTDEVIDGPTSLVAAQARNRILTQAAVLHEVLA